MTTIAPEVSPSAPAVELHVDEVLGIAEVRVDGLVAPEGAARVAASLSCRLHAAIERAATGVVVDLGPHCDATDPAVARVLACAHAGATARGIALDVI